MSAKLQSLNSTFEARCDPRALAMPTHIRSIEELKSLLDEVHIEACLLRPFHETANYPLVESRELLPSFEADVCEYKELPGFSLVALNRPINYFQEVFQFDILHNLIDQCDCSKGYACPLEQTVLAKNLQTMLNRLPRHSQERFRLDCGQLDVTDLEHYAHLLPYLLQMDRAHVLATDTYGNFNLAGTYASFPSDLDTEIKRFGLRHGKFKVGDNIVYERNRIFVYQFLMELYGFPIVSERRTSSALFARRLHKMGEQFLIRVLGQSDRTLTTLYSHPGATMYPQVEKIALVKVEKEQHDLIKLLVSGGFFVDRERRAVILRVRYRQHKFNPNNVRQDRALSVESQEIIHPETGKVLTNVNIIKDTTNMFLRLNDIIRGEYVGKIVYKRHEVVENTDTDEKRLKFLYAWLSKHQRRIIGYSEEFFANVVIVLDHYLLNPDRSDLFNGIYELHQEVWAKYNYIQQARKVRQLEDIHYGQGKENKGYSWKLKAATDLLQDLKFEIVNYFEELVGSIIRICDEILNDRYLIKTYYAKKDDVLTPYGQEVKKYYRKLVVLTDEFKSIRKFREDNPHEGLRKTG